jgi:hypothetical protein
VGAVSVTDTETTCSGATGAAVRGKTALVVMATPSLAKTTAYPAFQVQVPAFFSRQVLVKTVPGGRVVPSGMVTSSTKVTRSHRLCPVGVA